MISETNKIRRTGLDDPTTVERMTHEHDEN